MAEWCGQLKETATIGSELSLHVAMMHPRSIGPCAYYVSARIVHPYLQCCCCIGSHQNRKIDDGERDGDEPPPPRNACVLALRMERTVYNIHQPRTTERSRCAVDRDKNV